MTSSLYDAYETDKDSERSGNWITDVGSSRFLLARMGGANTKYQKALTQAMKPFMRELQLGMADEALLEPVLRNVFLDTVLLSWENVPDRDGTIMDFNKENVRQLFADLPDLYARLREQASNYSNYRASLIKAAAGN